MPEINRLEQRKQTRQEPNPNLNATTTIASSATPGLVPTCLPSHPGTPQVEGHWGERHWGEGHWGEGHWGERHWGEGHWGEGHWGEGHRGEGHRVQGHWGERPQGEGHQGEGHCGDSRHLPIQSAAADPHRHRHPHLRCFRLPQLLAELAPPGEVFALSQTPNAPAH
jgi:hypothetical protein